MKKLFLLLAGACISVGAMAQDSHSMLFTPTGTAQANTFGGVPFIRTTNAKLSHLSSANKGTSANESDWYYIYDALYLSGTSVNYYFAISEDSNIAETAGGNIFARGMGMSFDPSDAGYSGGAVNPLYTPPAVPFIDSYAYTADTFLVNAKYIRHDNSVSNDSLIIELAVTQLNQSTTDSGVYTLSFGAASASFASISTDSVGRFASAEYNRTYHDIYSTAQTQKRRYAVSLTATTVADTDANGNQVPIQIPILPTITVPQHSHLVSYVHFKASKSYALGTPETSANIVHLFAGDPSGASNWTPIPGHKASTGYPGSFQTGLFASNQTSIYTDTTKRFRYDSHDILIPAIAYTNPPGFEVVDQAFHIKWVNMLDVNNVNANKITSRAYPNPANTIAHIPFTLTQAANVNITFTNAVGQVVGTKNMGYMLQGTADFNTSTLASGVYFYTIEADGLRSTGRVVVSH